MNKDVVLDYLREKKKAMSLDEIAVALKLDSFLVEKILMDHIDSLKVKTKGNKYIATDYKTGFLNTTNNGKAYVKYNNSKIWISQNKLNGAKDGDTVLVNITNTSKDSYAGEIINIIERFKKKNVGTVVNLNGKFYIKSDTEKIYIDAADLILGDKVIYEKYNLIRNNIYTGKVIKSIGHIDDPKIDIISTLAAYNIETTFNDEALKEASNLPKEVTIEDKVGRKDLTKEMIFTIDGDDSKEVDDAISLKINSAGNYVLGVHIADVSHYVKVDSALDKEAYNRGTSVYPPGAVVPMLPHIISSGICSLFSGVERLTMSCEMEFDRNGNLLDYKIFPSFINSSKRMTYSKVNQLLDGTTPYGYEEFEKTLKLMNKFKNVLREKRFKNGSIDFDIPKVNVSIDEVGRPTSVYKEERCDAEKMIEEFMLVANKTVATDLSNYGESLYRVHDYPDLQRINDAVNRLKALGIRIPKDNVLKNSFIIKLLDNIKNSDIKEVASEEILRSMAKAIYSKDNHGHYGLAFDKYTHFTSPIRRYPDLTVHRLIKYYYGYNIDMPSDLKDYLNVVGIHSSLQERNSDECESIIRKMKMAEYMEDKDGTYDANIIDISQNGMLIKLYNGIIGSVKFDTKANVGTVIAKTKYKLYKIGDPIEVTLDFADKATGEIRFKEKIKKY